MSRVLAVDPGTRRIGLAISDTARLLAFPRPSVDAGEFAVEQIATLVRAEAATLVLVGRPLSLAGRITESTAMAEELRSALAVTLDDVEVVAVDERLTTVTAQSRLDRAGVRRRDQREVVDSASATVLLQSFLDATAR